MVQFQLESTLHSNLSLTEMSFVVPLMASFCVLILKAMTHNSFDECCILAAHCSRSFHYTDVCAHEKDDIVI